MQTRLANAHSNSLIPLSITFMINKLTSSIQYIETIHKQVQNILKTRLKKKKNLNWTTEAHSTVNIMKIKGGDVQQLLLSTSVISKLSNDEAFPRNISRHLNSGDAENYSVTTIIHSLSLTPNHKQWEVWSVCNTRSRIWQLLLNHKLET